MLVRRRQHPLVFLFRFDSVPEPFPLRFGLRPMLPGPYAIPTALHPEVEEMQSLPPRVTIPNRPAF